MYPQSPFKEHKYQDINNSCCYFPLKHMRKTTDWFNGPKLCKPKNLAMQAKIYTTYKVNDSDALMLYIISGFKLYNKLR